MDMREIGARIKQRREYLSRTGPGYSCEEVAAKLGLTRMAYCHFEEGRREIGALDLVKLGETLHCKMAYFFSQDKGPASLIDLSTGSLAGLHSDRSRQMATRSDIDQVVHRLEALMQILLPDKTAAPEAREPALPSGCQQMVSLELQTVSNVQARVYHRLRASQAREQYIESLRLQAEAALALLEQPLDEAEEREHRQRFPLRNPPVEDPAGDGATPIWNENTAA
jgi:transcriptional regulator with XRE-family HTH domain